MRKKLVTCKTCGAEIAKDAKVCPACGGKNKRSKPGFLAIAIFVIAILIMFSGGDDTAPTTDAAEQDITYTVYTVDKLVEDLRANALKAEETYQDQYVELTGRINGIDSDGSYISIEPVNDRYTLLWVQCFLKDDAQVEAVKDMAVGDVITVRGQITDIGEILGYLMDVAEFVE